MQREVSGLKIFKFSKCSNFEKRMYYSLISRFLSQLVLEYPGFFNWYNKLFTAQNELVLGREILIAEIDYQVAGVAILKNDGVEKKICTLRVGRKYRNQGIGHKLMESSFEWLGSEKPMVTVRKSKYKYFDSMFKYYGFDLAQEAKQYYSFLSTEFVFNGELPQKQILLNRVEIFDISQLCKMMIDSGKLDWDLLIEQCINLWSCRERKILDY